MSKDTRNYYAGRKDQNTMNYYARKSSGGQGIICDEDTGRTVKGDEMTTNKLYIVIFGLLGLILLPVTGLWALFAYLAGDKYPLYALRGENVDDDLIDNP